MPISPRAGRLLRLAWAPLCLLLAACHTSMYDQARYEYQEPSAFFADGRSARPLPPGSVQYRDTGEDTHFNTGRVDGDYVAEFPYPVDEAMLMRGQQRYDMFCLPCHGITGNGDGFIARRGAIRVASLHDQRIRDASVGYLFDIISNGVGRMYGYASRIDEQDRWAIIAYIRALQLSQNATADDLPPEERARLVGE